nr:uncharacterized protein K02A2.6-like [Haemonchus contortus]
MASNKPSCSSRLPKDTTTGDQDNDFKDYAAIAGMPEDPAMKDLLQMMANQQKLLVDLLQKMATSTTAPQETLFDRISRRIEKFSYDADQDDHFDLWFNRHKDIFEVDCQGMEEAKKTRLLVAALDAASHTRFVRHILPKEPRDLNWTDTVETLKTLFGTKKSVFRRRFECFRINFSPNEDIDNFVNLLKDRALEANFKDIRKDTPECLALVFAFQAPELVDYRVRFLRSDSKIVEAANSPEIRTVQNRKKLRLLTATKPRLPPSPCPICQQQHWKKDYPQNRRATSAAQESRTAPRRRAKQSSPRTWTQRAIGRTGDVQKYLEVHINGHPTRLQLDTGADVTIISRPTWMQLGSPRLQKTSDVFKGANGLPLPIHGKFDADFKVMDNQGKAHPGEGVCYVSDDNDLLGITWIEQISDFNSVLKRFNIQKVQTLDYDAIRDKTIAKRPRRQVPLRDDPADLPRERHHRCWTPTRSQEDRCHYSDAKTEGYRPGPVIPRSHQLLWSLRSRDASDPRAARRTAQEGHSIQLESRMRRRFRTRQGSARFGPAPYSLQPRSTDRSRSRRFRLWNRSSHLPSLPRWNSENSLSRKPLPQRHGEELRTNEKEGLALIYAVRKFHRYIYGRHFTLLTDHKPLLAIFGSKKRVPAYLANRLQRWRLTLRAYDFDIEYRSTTSFGQADALSRLISAQSPPEEDVIIATIARDVNAIFRDNVNRLPVTAEDVARATAEDDCLRQVLDHVVHNKWPKKLSPTVANYAHLRNDLSTQQGCLLFGAASSFLSHSSQLS